MFPKRVDLPVVVLLKVIKPSLNGHGINGHANKRNPQEPNPCEGIDQGFHDYPPLLYFSIDRPTNQNVSIMFSMAKSSSS
jgi:hypothetical protein